jgi:predicted nucleic acid-binding Zn ribbon protein
LSLIDSSIPRDLKVLPILDACQTACSSASFALLLSFLFSCQAIRDARCDGARRGRRAKERKKQTSKQSGKRRDDIVDSIFTPGTNSGLIRAMDMSFYALFAVLVVMVVLTRGNGLKGVSRHRVPSFELEATLMTRTSHEPTHHLMLANSGLIRAMDMSFYALFAVLVVMVVLTRGNGHICAKNLSAIKRRQSAQSPQFRAGSHPDDADIARANADPRHGHVVLRALCGPRRHGRLDKRQRAYLRPVCSASMDRDCGLAVDACVAMSSYSRCEM